MSESVWNKVSGFVAARKAAVIIGTVAVVGTGAGAYFYYLNNSSPKPKGKKSKKLNKNEKKKLKKAREAEASKKIAGFKLTKDEEFDAEYPDIEDFSAVTELPAQEKSQLAQSFKEAGNKYFGKQEYNKALDLYGKALKCEIDPVFYSNRAACYSQLEDYENAIEESNKALAIKPDYVKSLVRRAGAYEKLKNYPEALIDFSSALILKDLKDDTLNKTVERVHSVYATQRAAKLFSEREPSLPSATTIASFFQTLDPVEIPEDIISAEPETGEFFLKTGLEAIINKDYDVAYDNIKKAVEKETTHRALALSYRAVFEFLSVETEKSLEDVQEVLNTEPTTIAHLVRANLFMSIGNVAAADIDYSSALAINPKSAAVYYQRAQARFMTQKVAEAFKDYEKAIELDHSFVLAHIQNIVGKYRAGKQQVALTEFEALLHTFPNSVDVHNYYGELLLDQNRLDDAIAQFDKAIEINKNSGEAVNAILYVNKSIAAFKSNPSGTKHVELAKQATELDPLSESAWSTLSQFYIQQEKIEDSIQAMFKAAECSRSPEEAVQLFVIISATEAQIRIAKERPFLAEKVNAIKASMQAAQAAQGLA
ncbi:hypothetical protein DV495_004367 [Geotrichum candidum]|uniref:Similar to Saccharomyces cerevisiae YNL121C TOM70 Component of the TOM (Translocase of outer membrane) complex responsible for recognition and initial import steps for all mitochondrially proteins n=1 Tax=Geotrichum candidum TaxID=1173061 RepID=A0A0J9X2K3_GEOCN|nr:hypothetical protein DV454_004169 [Geotrichum candidum]KAI9211897.1 hypothetical protein DS838_003235 [Geotrichum bryndzae]KAF5118246.1 hypothetical protein DV452_002113 [Geotrichum candidum]KAF5121358.1 hypothetical protein DV495_004367 [Geotrichum candidum]KAF7499103.1 hypothetical protein DV113_002857 [Geotrichum candidum]